MKRALLLTVSATAFLFIGHTRAQSMDSVSRAKDSTGKVSFGVKAGGIFNQVHGNATFKNTFTTGILGGAFVESVKKKWGIQAEALISSARYNNDSGGSYFSLIYANILVLPEYELIPHLWLQAGAEVSTFLSVSRTPSQSLDPKNYFQSPDFSGVLGLEAKLPKRFTVGARYLLGFSNIRNGLVSYTSQSWTTSAIQVYIGYRIQ